MKKKVIIPIIVAIIVAGGLGIAGTSYYANLKARNLEQTNATLRHEVTQQTQAQKDSSDAIQINLHIKDGAFELAQKEIASLTDPKTIQALNDKLNTYKENAQNFNNSIKNALNAINQSGNIDAFSKAINGVNTDNLVVADQNKLSKIKDALPSLKSLQEVQNLILARKFIQAKDEFNKINENALINAGILTQAKITKIQNFVNAGLNENKQIIDSVNSKIKEFNNK